MPAREVLTIRSRILGGRPRHGAGHNTTIFTECPLGRAFPGGSVFLVRFDACLPQPNCSIVALTIQAIWLQPLGRACLSLPQLRPRRSASSYRCPNARERCSPSIYWRIFKISGSESRLLRPRGTFSSSAGVQHVHGAKQATRFLSMHHMHRPVVSHVILDPRGYDLHSPCISQITSQTLAARTAGLVVTDL